MNQITTSNNEICLLRSHISSKLTCMRSANLQESLIFRSFAVVLKEPHPFQLCLPTTLTASPFSIKIGPLSRSSTGVPERRNKHSYELPQAAPNPPCEIMAVRA